MIWLLLFSLIKGIAAHGYISQPAAVYKDPSTKTSFITTIDGNCVYPAKWDNPPDESAAQLARMKNWSSLKEFFSSHVQGCPKNDLSSVISVNYNTMKWQNDEERKGFIPSHAGPCEAWVDDKMVFSNDNCAKSITSYPAEMPIDYSVCKGECLFQFYWLALHERIWQLYKGCVRIKVGESSYSSTPTVEPSGCH